MVMVEMRVRVDDIDKFRQAYADHKALFARNPILYCSEADPNELAMVAEWDSHDVMHASSEKRGPGFQAAAGTEGLEWETRIWRPIA